MSEQFPVQRVLELACAAQRLNKEYIKETNPVYSDDSKLMGYVWANKMLVLLSLYPENYRKSSEDEPPPPLLRTNADDTVLSQEIIKYFRRLMFAAVQGENEFQTEVNALLNSETIPASKFGFIACLPSVYKRDHAQNQIKKLVNTIDNTYLGLIGENVLDKDCEILSSQRSKNFDAWNIDAIIDNMMVSWMSKTDLKIGACVVIKAKIKDHSKHWKHENPVTRLNYVKVAQ